MIRVPLPHGAPGPPRAMQVRRAARERYDFDEALFSLHGRMLVADFGAAQRVAHKINAARQADRFPESAVRAGDLHAAGLLEEILHLVVAAYRQQVGPDLFAGALAHAADAVGSDAVESVLTGFAGEFPPLPVHRGEATAAAYLAARTDGVPHREVAAEELLLLRIANDNPALVRFRELFDEAPLAAAPEYRPTVQALERYFDQLPPFAGAAGGMSLLSLLRAPSRASPTSLEGQLRWVRDNWRDLLGADFAALVDRLLLAIDILAEERKQGGFGHPGPPPVLTAEALRGGPRLAEYERFSADSSWMPRVVLLAKSTYVWLHQLSEDYQRDISRLDQIPDEELDRLAAAGFTALWLIGLWERSDASRRIKHLRGDPEAVASAYALYDYVIAADLGGELAYENLRNRAWQRGIRLASDMVPNHVGVDGRWVMEHPDRFLSLPEPPYPAYSFTGPDLSGTPGVTVQIEDHYWDGTDAAVVFRRHDHASGDVRFIYHGNDGTSMPWNDTAQLDYLNPETREAVIQTIFHVARKFPIIRFDAAMTLAKLHIQRLWYPEPGEGGAIPSRAAHGMTAAEFDRHLPHEFWREVVDRVATEVPDTLLLAEAFWMMEGYFVRTLGMHRVYNSAFMHMMAAEKNGEYRRLMRNVLEFDTEVLQRFVNFMNNPDEETAVAQFGKDDKYFGVATVMVTMPGLPMFGHGQVEGYGEKYGMEFRRPKLGERPDEWLVERHRREIFPLLHRRAQFAGAAGFLLYDVQPPGGGVNEDVYAYSNLVDGAASLVLFNNKYERAEGRIHSSVPYRDKALGALRVRSLADGLGLRADADDWVVFREHRDGLEYLRRSADIAAHGFEMRLDGFEYRVFLDFREVADTSGEYARLAARLGGGGVPSVDEALAAERLAPVHDALAGLAAAAAGDDFATAVPAALRAFAAAAAGHGVEVDTGGTRLVAALTRAGAPDPEHDAGEAPAGGWRRVVAALIEAADAGDAEQLRLVRALPPAFAAAGFGEVADRSARIVLLARRHADWAERKPEGATRRAPAPRAAATFLAGLAGDAEAEAALEVNEHEGTRWFGGEAFDLFVAALTAIGLARANRARDRRRVRSMAATLRDLAAGSRYDWDDLTG